MNIDFLLTSLIVVASPGTGVLYTVACGLSRGVRTGVVAAFGCTLGIIPHMLTAVLGLAAVFTTSPVAFDIVKYAGVAYLIYMAIMTLREKGPLQIDDKSETSSTVKIIISAIFLNLLNPKLPIFFLAFLPQFVELNDPHPVSHMFNLSAIFMLITFIVFVLYGTFAAFMRSHILSTPRILRLMRITFAGGFIGLAIKLAVSHQ
ncbi:LysE family translocator [Salmonella enterica]|nr:LysE family translocator [Salmonella enterica]EHN5210927.1 LysE family translocator [Salmonella enterica subsp. enterica serovar Baildon]ECR9490629.1 LysE family translocator [Salmonella enterica]EDC2073299.1 LysE family translocator [Salmonella enterica]EDS3116760.1 LysE family translocator [Salmonella enterica]